MNIGTTKSKKKQDIKNQKDINKLCTKKIQASEKLQHYNDYLVELNEEIRLRQIDDSGKHKKSKTYKKPKIHCDLDSLLFKVSDNETNQYKSTNV